MQGMEAHPAGIEQHIRHGYHCPYEAAYRGSQGGTLDAHTEREDEEPVQYRVEHGTRDAAPHGEARGAVQAYGEERDLRPHLEEQRGREPYQVVLDQRQEVLRRAQDIRHACREEHYRHNGNDCDDGDEDHCLRQTEIGRAHV